MKPINQHPDQPKSLFLFPMVYLSTRDAVEQYFNLEPGAILSKCRKQEIRQARHIAMFFDHMLIKNYTGKKGWLHIARGFGNMNHASIMHAVKTVKSDLRYRPFKKMMIELSQTLFTDIEFLKLGSATQTNYSYPIN